MTRGEREKINAAALGLEPVDYRSRLWLLACSGLGQPYSTLRHTTINNGLLDGWLARGDGMSVYECVEVSV